MKTLDAEIVQSNVKDLEEIVQMNRDQFERDFHQRVSFTAVAPGRINIIGEHTDYNDGLALPVAINRWVVISFSPSGDETIQIKSFNYQSELKFSLNESPDVTESWQKFVLGAFEIFKEEFPVTCGFKALIWGNVPIGSGVSSSAAIEVAMMNGLRQLYSADFDDLTLIQLCQRIEHEYLNINSGLLDQYASQFSRVGKILLLDFMEMDHKYINAEMDKCAWVLVDSKVKRELSKSKYTERVEETHQAYVFLLSARIGIHSHRDIREEHIALLPNEIWKKRMRHYVSENQRVLNAVEYISTGNFDALGKELIKSHYSLSYDYEVSCKELDFLAELAVRFNGCLGSRMMGGGFGGCTINLVKTDMVDQFMEHIKRAYKKEFNIVPDVNEYQMVEGARILT